VRARVRSGEVIAVLRTSAANFGTDGAATHAAAIAYAAVFSIAPLLVIGIGIAGQALDITQGGHQHHVVEDRLIGLLAGAVGGDAAGTIRTIVDRSFASHAGSVIAQLAGWATFAIAASGLFLTLQNALNAVWHAKPGGGWLRTLRDRLMSLAMLAVVGILVLTSIVFDTILPWIGNGIGSVIRLPGGDVWFDGIDAVVSFALIVLLFALLFKMLPDAPVAWRDVGVGAVLTALLFLVGESALGVYLQRAGIANGYGAAGSLVVVLVWMYYSAMLLLFGAEVTRTLSERRTQLPVGPGPAPS
jgi:membrane protein